ncbi:MAG: serpin family protein [Bacteroidales bacterium]|nr:serpin family protein [Bacteroidales bacterium]
MKTVRFLIMAAGMLVAAACEDIQLELNPINVSSPVPTTQITKVALNETQQSYVNAGNSMAFKLLNELYDGKNLVCSPLSLQYALAMAANGASGQTLQEIIDVLGYGNEGIDALNEYSRILLEQLPAVDLDVTLKVTDALLVNNDFPLLPAFKQTVEEYYYAAVDNMDFSYPAQVAARVNNWAKRNTNGFIDNVLNPDDVSAQTVALLMNALYFKAKWSGTQYEPMFNEESTIKDVFTSTDGSKTMLNMMRNVRYHKYAEMDGYTVLALPYAGGKFYMYFLLPDGNDLPGLLAKMKTLSWDKVLSNLKQDAEVHVKIPKFDIEERYSLNQTLESMGMKVPFQPGVAKFDRMFAPKDPGYDFWIGKVIQKARISVAEWGTEAAAVTVVTMDAAAAAPEPEPKRIDFYADHPFVFIIGESTSGTILFEGAFTGKQ